MSHKRSITTHYHCKKCIAELPAGESPESYARFTFGSTPRGFQLWCVRHECNIIHLDMLGTVVQADLTDAGDFGDTPPTVH